MFPFTLQQLLILKALATEKNFTKAADLVYLSQPSLSKQIKILEKNLNVLIIHRENNKISFTENGKVLLDYSERILALSQEYCRVLVDFQNNERGHLTIGGSPKIGKYLLPKVLELFFKNYPAIDLKMKVNSTRMILQNVKSRKVDIGLISGEIPRELKKYVLVKFFVNDEIHLILPKYHFLTVKGFISKEDLYHLNFITLPLNTPFRKFIDTILIQNQIEINQLKISMQVNSVEKIKAAVSLGLGAAFVSSSAMEEEKEGKTLEIIKIENMRIYQSFFIVSNFKSFQTKACTVFSRELSKLKNNF